MEKNIKDMSQVMADTGESTARVLSGEESFVSDGKVKKRQGTLPSGRNVRQRHELLLLSNEAASVAGRMLQGTMWSMHVLSVMFFFKSAELSDEEMQSVREGIMRMSVLSRDFYAELDSVRRKIRDGRLEGLLDNVTVSPKFRRNVVLKTPMEKEFVVCLTNFDRLVVLYGFFWVNNLFNPVSCRKRIIRLKNRLTDVCAYVLSVRHKLERNTDRPRDGQKGFRSDSFYPVKRLSRKGMDEAGGKSEEFCYACHKFTIII